MLASSLDPEVHRSRGQDLADAVMSVEHDQRTGVGDDGRLGHRLHRATSQPGHIPRQAQHPVGGVPPQFGRDQAVGQ
jgi:hypothetical protein